MVTISQNGMYEQVDTMKSVFAGAHETGLSVVNSSLNDVLNSSFVSSRQSGINGLSDTCKNCKIVNVCGGGYYPHRYSLEHNYMNPSVYCKDLYKLINHINNRIVLNLVQDDMKLLAIK